MVELETPRRLIARRIPEVGCAVYDRDTGVKVSPAGDAWWPNLRRAKQALNEMEAQIDILPTPKAGGFHGGLR